MANSIMASRMHYPPPAKLAFSLVELSIVLVILGLLTGGILAGQSLIRAAELRSVVADFQRYKAAANTFREKYFALPGDMANATDFWGTAANCPGTAAQGSTTAATCNGNGNGNLEPWNVTPLGNEQFRFWQQLANAGLIEGSYSGVQGVAMAITPVPGQNSPRPRISNMAWFNYYLGNFAGDGWSLNHDYGNILSIGDVASSTGFAPEEAWNVDTKLDDGLPAQGFVLAGNRTQCTTSTGVNDYAARYQLSSTSKVCQIVYARFF
ncbi:MAG: type II secretion system protein [Rickettsiales bacterium]